MNIGVAKDLKRFFYKLILFFITVVILDQAFGKVLRIIYFKQNHGGSYKTTYSFEKDSSQVLIIGSSKAHHNYEAQMFEDSLHLSCYNAGLDGHFIFYYDAVLKCVLKRYSPKIIILDVLNDELAIRPENYDRLSTLLPYYATHPEIRNLIALKGPYERIKFLSGIYPFNSLIVQSVSAAIDLHNKRLVENKLKGFEPLNTTNKEKLSKPVYNAGIDSNCVNTLESFVQDCNSKQIKLFIVVSPYFVENTGETKSTETVKMVAEKYHITLWDNSQNQYFLTHPEFFSDYNHLNEKGASVFTKMIIEKIKDSL
jgi:hypothetical protein